MRSAANLALGLADLEADEPVQGHAGLLEQAGRIDSVDMSAAAVRFRNTLEDSKDAVYIFLATAIGLASGEPLPAVQVAVTGTQRGAVTNEAVEALFLRRHAVDLLVGEGLERTRHVGLHDEVELLLAALGSRAAVFTMGYEPEGDQLEIGRKLVQEYKIQSLTTCSTCHCAS